MTAKTVLGVVAVLAVAFSWVVQAATVEETLRSWRSDRRIQVTLNSGEKLTGRLGAIEPGRFTLEPDNQRTTRREVQFDEVRSAKTKMTRTTKWIIGGAIYLGLVGLGTIINN